MQTTYRAGDWYILVSPGVLIALPPEAPHDLVTSLWERERADGDLATVIDALTDHAAGSFAAMLPFAAVVLDGTDARFAVRGDATVQITGPDGAESFTGTNVTTWNERFVANASRIAVSIDDADESAALPISSGIVRAAHATADIEPDDVVVADADADADADAAVDDPSTGSGIGGAVDDPSTGSGSGEAVDDPSTGSGIGEAEGSGIGGAEDDPSTGSGSGEAEDGEGVDDAVNGATLMPVETTYASDADEFDQLFGATVVSPSAVAPPPPPAASVPMEGDHDGATISVAEARALRVNPPTAEPDAPTAVLPTVAGPAGRISVSTGQVVTLDRTVIVGRRPRSTRASGAELPHLVAVESPQQDISRSHLEIRPEGDTVVVVDLHTTNGSMLLRPGADPLRLHPGEQTVVLSGDQVDLGDGVIVTFEDIP